MINQDTICAISTAPGAGGVAVIRVSGSEAIAICNTVFVPKVKGKDLLTQKAYTLSYGSICNGEELIDDVIVSLFRNPNSFTGEDTVEITCHGSVFIQQQIMQLLVDRGCRTALPGEYTQRAFLNGKMDLSQAEAVADLIASTSAGMHKLALNQMRGGFSNELTRLRTQLLDFTSLIELELDFSEEDVEFADRTQLKKAAESIETLIHKLVDSFNTGNVIKNGIPVAIIGETNAGKSTLLNLLLNEEKAIVSDIHGTTRDVIEDTLNIRGITFRLIDTAGIRETDDTIESLGIERTFKKLEQANIILWVVDIQTPNEHIEALYQRLSPMLDGKKLILLLNKADMAHPQIKLEKSTLLTNQIQDCLYISAKYKEGLTAIEDLLVKAANIPQIGDNDIVVTNVRHYEALSKALQAIQRVRTGLENNISGDFLSQDIRECMHYLGEITGEISNDNILANIFAKFCIGK